MTGCFTRSIIMRILRTASFFSASFADHASRVFPEMSRIKAPRADNLADWRRLVSRMRIMARSIVRPARKSSGAVRTGGVREGFSDFPEPESGTPGRKTSGRSGLPTCGETRSGVGRETAEGVGAETKTMAYDDPHPDG